MLKIKDMASTAGWETEGVKQNLMKEMMIMDMLTIKDDDDDGGTERNEDEQQYTKCTSPARLKTTSLWSRQDCLHCVT